MKDKMILEQIIVGGTETNCYIIGCANTKETAIIDPGADFTEINTVVHSLKLKPKFVINTHGHADHIGANRDFNLPILIHTDDADFLKDPAKNLSALFGTQIKSPKPERLLNEGDKIQIGDIALEVIHTPGHTPGGICLKTDSIVFTGDTLFCGGVGRTDFAYSSEDALFKAIKEKLLVLPKETVIYPGHGPHSTIGEEKKSL